MELSNQYLTLQDQTNRHSTCTCFFIINFFCLENKWISFVLPVKVGDDFDLNLAALELQFE